MIAAPPPHKTTPSFALPTSARALNLAIADISHLKLMSCYFAMLGVTLFWLVALTKYAQKPGCLAWCLTFTIISFALAIKLFLEQIQRTSAPLQYSAAQESRSFIETLTGAYALTSLAICIAFLNTQWYKIDRTVMTQQIIEIDLSPIATAIEHVPLAKQPSRTPQTLPAKIETAAPTATQLTPVARTVRQPVPQPAKQPNSQPAKPTVVLNPAPSLANKIKSLPGKVVAWPTNATAPPVTAQSRAGRKVPQVSTGSSFFMEELPPAQLVEVRETDNSKPAALRSNTNSPSPPANMSVLADYLRDLHRAIKSAWTPPRDNTRSAEIIFRIKRSGELALVKVVRSSGDVDSDESAINAITASAPFKPLPAAYALASLDVDYTFNYTSDKLTEVGAGYH